MNKITLFIGLNDKDSKRQEITTGEARAILADRIAKKIGFGTVSLASGVYTHDMGKGPFKSGVYSCRSLGALCAVHLTTV